MKFLSQSRLIAIGVLFLSSLFFTYGKVDTIKNSGNEALKEWRAGETVSAKDIIAFGIDNCFLSEPIPDRIWNFMQGKTYKENPHIKRSDLRHIRVLHWDYDKKIHIGEMVCNSKIADRLVMIFRTLYENQYCIQRMVLPDVYNANDEKQMSENNTSCFCYRVVEGSNKLSKHARGLAVDLNPLYNPYVRKNSKGKVKVQPSNATEYCNRRNSFRYKIDENDLAYRLFIQHGFRWGGSWKTMKDYQHFEWTE